MRLHLKRRIFKLLSLAAAISVVVLSYQYLRFQHFLTNFQWPPNVEVAHHNEGHDSNARVVNDWSKYGTLIEPKFSSSRQNCSDSDKQILVVVKTAPDRVDRRAAIRETYGSIKTMAGFRLDYVFVMGTMPGWEQALAGEAQKWGDLLVGDYQDNYHNNTLKFLSSIQLARHFCGPSRAVPFLLLLDDDYVMLPWALVKEVREHRPTEGLYMGYCYLMPFPSRQHGSKHEITYAEYPYDYTPPYCAAGSVLLSRRTVEQFYGAIPYVKLFRIDDVYTGILAHLVKIPTTHNLNFWLWVTRLELVWNTFTMLLASPGGLWWHGIICAHGYGPDEMRTLFARLNGTQNFT